MEAACPVECPCLWSAATPACARITVNTLRRRGFGGGSVCEVSRLVRRNKRYPRGCSTVVAIDKDGFDELAVPLDLLLTRPVFGLAERITPNMSWRRFAINLARQPGVVASRAGTLGRELGAVVAGRSEIAPAKGDKRFADPAWVGNPILKRTMQAYLAANAVVDQLFSDPRLHWADAE